MKVADNTNRDYKKRLLLYPKDSLIAYSILNCLPIKMSFKCFNKLNKMFFSSFLNWKILLTLVLLNAKLVLFLRVKSQNDKVPIA